MTAQPDEWHTVTPRIVTREPRRLVQFLKEVFGASGMRLASAVYSPLPGGAARRTAVTLLSLAVAVVSVGAHPPLDRLLTA